MYAPRVFASILCVLIVFAGATYVMTGSIWTVVIQTVFAAIILQVGYFIGVVYLVRREQQASERKASPEASNPVATPGRSLGDSAAEKAASLIGAQTFHRGTSEKS